jgi:tryptophan synthase alpha chain
MHPSDRLEEAIRRPRSGSMAILPYIAAGYPTRAGFTELVQGIGAEADALEIGVPFSDPMADGVTVQEATRIALEQGVTLEWILASLASIEVGAPISLMSYLNPLLAYGLPRLVEDAAEAGVCAFIVPDLPLHEGGELRALAEARGLGVVQLVTPVTTHERMNQLVAASRGFVYAVTVTGTTGTSAKAEELMPYLDRVRAASSRPVCAGFGIKTQADVAALQGHADGAIVGAALLQTLGSGGDGAAFVRSLRVSTT